MKITFSLLFRCLWKSFEKVREGWKQREKLICTDLSFSQKSNIAKIHPLIPSSAEEGAVRVKFAHLPSDAQTWNQGNSERINGGVAPSQPRCRAYGVVVPSQLLSDSWCSLVPWIFQASCWLLKKGCVKVAMHDDSGDLWMLLHPDPFPQPLTAMGTLLLEQEQVQVFVTFW